MQRGFRKILPLLVAIFFGCSKSEHPPTEAEVDKAVRHILRLNMQENFKNFQLGQIQREIPRRATLSKGGKEVVIYPLIFGVELELADGSPLKKMADADKSILENEKIPKTNYFYRINGKWMYTMHPEDDLKWIPSQ
jgi:hypothetical protein